MRCVEVVAISKSLSISIQQFPLIVGEGLHNFGCQSIWVQIRSGQSECLSRTMLEGPKPLAKHWDKIKLQASSIATPNKQPNRRPISRNSIAWRTTGTCNKVVWFYQNVTSWFIWFIGSLQIGLGRVLGLRPAIGSNGGVSYPLVKVLVASCYSATTRMTWCQFSLGQSYVALRGLPGPR